MIRVTSTCGLAPLVACGHSPDAPPRAAAETRSTGVAADAQAVAAHYAGDAVISVPGAPPVRGSRAIREAVAKAPAPPAAAAGT